MNEQPSAASLDAPAPIVRHPWAIWLWLLPVICVSLTPLLLIMFAGVAMFTGATLPGEAWQIAGVALGIVSGMLIGVGASQAVTR